MEGAWLDISVPFGEEPLGGGGGAPGRGPEEHGDSRPSWLKRAAWMGTYVAAPPSVELDLEDMERLPLTSTVGKARVLVLDDVDCIRADSLAEYEPRPGERLLLRTRNSLREWWKQPHGRTLRDAVGRGGASCCWSGGWRAWGVDYVSRGGFHAEGTRVHQKLREAGGVAHRGVGFERGEAGDARAGVPAAEHEGRVGHAGAGVGAGMRDLAVG